MSRTVLLPKLVGETKSYDFDFTSQLAATETISTKAVTAAVYSGTDASTSSLVSGSATSSGAIVSQKLTAGTSGVTYQLICTITTSAGQTLIMAAFLTVIPNVT